MENEVLLEILALIRNESLTQEELLKELSMYHESDIADAIPLLTEDEQKAFFAKLSSEELATLFPYLESPEEYIEEMDTSKAADILEEMDVDDAVDILEEVDEEMAEAIIEEMDKESREDVEMILQYEDDEIGSKMTTNYITIKKGSSIKEAMRSLIKQAPENDNIYNLFVVENDDKFYGTVILKDLITARENSNLEDITKTSYPTLNVHDKVDEVIEELQDMDMDIIPVLDDNEVILGVITSGDITEIVQTEAEEDYNRLAGLTKQEEEEEPLWGSIKKRIPWLALLLVLGMLVSTVLTNFSVVIQSVTAAVLFQSVVFDMAGNGGTQSLAVTLTKITKDSDITGKRFGKMLLREFFVGLLNGVILGSLSAFVCFVFLVIRHQPVTTLTTEYSIIDCLKVASCVGLSLLSALSISSILGLVLPIFFNKIKIDPAVASGPMITTINDIVSACIYYALVGIMFGVFFGA